MAIKFSLCIFCCGFLLFSCKSPQEKTKPAKYTVEIKEMKFQPAALTVKSGDTVVWINRDIVAHDVTEEAARAWSSSSLPTGASWSMVVTKSADYFCSIHVVMKGKLLVQ